MKYSEPANGSKELQLGLWEISVLCLLRERPMHPYEMQRLLRERHKEELLVLKRGSLYHAIARLRRQGLIEAHESERAGKRPERTIYRLLEEGERQLLACLRGLLAQPIREQSRFMTAVSDMLHLPPAEVIEAFEKRTAALAAAVAAENHIFAVMGEKLGRMPLIEREYARAMLQAELDWCKSVLEELRTGALTWDVEQILSYMSHGAKHRPWAVQGNAAAQQR